MPLGTHASGAVVPDLPALGWNLPIHLEDDFRLALPLRALVKFPDLELFGRLQRFRIEEGADRAEPDHHRRRFPQGSAPRLADFSAAAPDPAQTRQQVGQIGLRHMFQPDLIRRLARTELLNDGAQSRIYFRRIHQVRYTACADDADSAGTLDTHVTIRTPLSLLRGARLARIAVEHGRIYQTGEHCSQRKGCLEVALRHRAGLGDRQKRRPASRGERRERAARVEGVGHRRVAQLLSGGGLHVPLQPPP